MKIITLKTNLQKILNIIQKIIIKNPKLQILENILIEVENKKIKISATNLELGLNILLNGKIEGDGKVCVPLNLISNIINNSKDERIELNVENLNLIIKSDNYKAIIKGYDYNDFPIIPNLNTILLSIKNKEKENILELKTKEIRELIFQLENIAIISETHPELSGIYLKFKKDEIEAVATDGIRLGIKKIKILNNNINKNIILPLISFYELIQILNLEEYENVKIIINDNQIVFDFGDIYFISRLISGNYPNYEQIIPKEFNIILKLNKQEFINQLKLVSLFTSNNNDIKLEILNKDNKIKLTSQTQQGSSSSLIKADIDGEGIEGIVFNYKFILDGLNNIKDKNNIILKIQNESTPILIEGGEKDTFSYILMPIKS
ncbi:MAG: polymerase III subunit beta protein [Parcubacteria group bacterium GW2011_GWA2_31_28]|nr:MAG: polymerase III subunit beta protein [Parcubacteria group bacterium GW2011_GWA2_31_28]